jgi:hypothetical protein
MVLTRLPVRASARDDEHTVRRRVRSKWKQALAMVVPAPPDRRRVLLIFGCQRSGATAALVVAVAITGLSAVIAIGAEDIAWQAPAQLSIQRDSTGGWEVAVSLGSGVATHPRLELTNLGNVVWSSALASGTSVQHVMLPPTS